MFDFYFSSETLNDRRLNQAQRRAVHSDEFMPALAKMEPIYAEKEDAFSAWYEKTPMGKKRKKILMPDAGGDAGKDKKGGKGKGKKKKK